MSTQEGSKKKKKKSKKKAKAQSESGEDKKQETATEVVAEVPATISVAGTQSWDAATFRNPAYQYLSERQMRDLATSQEVVSFQSTDSVEKVVMTLTKKKLLSAPVFRGKQNLGFVDMLDIATYVIACAPDPNALVLSELESLKIAGRAIGLMPVNKVVSLSRRDPLLPVFEESPASEANAFFARGVHRVSLFNSAGETTGVLTQMDVGKSVGRQLHVGPLKLLGEKTLKELGYGECEIFTISENASVLTALQKIAATKVSALAVVDSKTGALVGNFSASDLQGLYIDKFPHLFDNVRNFLSKYSPNSLKPICGDENASLATNVKTILDEGIHHLWMIGEGRKPYGLFGLSDFCSIVHNYHLK
eukprot:gb/GEZN01007120.1/.p1 GENE.gb/GEZN01007120.1/~~gb/GEZN01007120.1/.p1  ORF type:complete len:363 (-),score=59.81 gb/GEZN01007120.1/:410-1498(-)